MATQIVRKLVAVLSATAMVFAFAAMTTTRASAAEVLKPTKGVGYAYTYKDRSKEDLVQILRNPQVAKEEMRVSCETLVEQVKAANYELPFEGCEGMAAEIMSNPDFVVEKCDDVRMKAYSIGLTNEGGDTFGKWSRKCLVDEQVLTYQGGYILSSTCMNPIINTTVLVNRGHDWRPVTKPVASAPPPTLTCPPIMTVRIYRSDAANVGDVRAQLADEHGGRKVKGAKPGDFDGDGSEANRVSRGYGRAIHESGTALSQSSHEVVVTQVRGDKEQVLFEGPITGEEVVPLDDVGPQDKFFVRPVNIGEFLSPMRGSGAVIIKSKELELPCGGNRVTMIER